MRQDEMMMRRRWRSLVHGACVAALLAPGTAASQASFAPACRSEEHRQFDFWIGEWEVDNRHRQPGGEDPDWYPTGTARARVYPILDGCAVVEMWEGLLSFADVVGFSIRAYNVREQAWDLVLLWPQPNEPEFAVFSGSFRHHRGEFYSGSTTSGGPPVISRFTFSDVAEDWLRWDVAISRDSGVTWDPRWIMEFTRLERYPTPLPADSARRCDFPDIYQLDFALGRWSGQAVMADGRELPVTMQAGSIVQGCATMELIDIGDGDWRGFQVRTFDPNDDRWEAYRMDTARPTLHRLDGRVRGAAARFEGTRVDEGGEVLIRREWAWTNDERLRITLSESSDGGTTWTPQFTANLSKLPGEALLVR